MVLITSLPFSSVFVITLEAMIVNRQIPSLYAIFFALVLQAWGVVPVEPLSKCFIVSSGLFPGV